MRSRIPSLMRQYSTNALDPEDDPTCQTIEAVKSTDGSAAITQLSQYSR